MFAEYAVGVNAEDVTGLSFRVDLASRTEKLSAISSQRSAFEPWPMGGLAELIAEG
jgi:hypothetical protein